MISIDIRRKAYLGQGRSREHLAISEFKLTLKADEFVCLAGPSGCGKTTLLNIVAGIDREFEGALGFEQNRDNPHIGYVFQNPRLLPWCSVRQNIELALPSATASESIDAFLHIMQLTEFQHVYPERLSLGMSRRVAIIRAFAINPELLLMDEPFVSLDAATAKQVRVLLLSLWRQRPHTVLFVTHDLREAIELADRIVFLTPAPMKIAHEIAVSIPRDQRDDLLKIESFRTKLVHDYPELNLIG